jgi:ankyrin repeat protein
MRSELLPRRVRVWMIAVSLACPACSRDFSDVAQDGSGAVRAVLEATSDPDRPDRHGDAMIHVAALLSDPPMLSVVIARGVQVDQRNRNDMTALGIAVDQSCLPCALELLQAHADPNATQGPRHDRPLHRAATRGSPELVEMLLDAGADPDGRNGRGETPLHAAANADARKAVAVARALLARGAHIDATDELGETPVHRAAERDAAELLTFYGGIGADLSAPNAWEATPLDRALETHGDGAAQVLYRLGAKVSWTERFEPPLLAAARVDDVERAEKLLARGADPRQAFEGKSAIDVARENASAGVLAVLTDVSPRP